MQKNNDLKKIEGSPIVDCSVNVVLIPPCSIGKNVVLENCTMGPGIVVEDNCIVKNVNLSGGVIKFGSVICGEKE